MRAHKYRRYSRIARIRRRLLAVRQAPTVAEGLSDVEARLQLRPLASGVLVAGSLPATYAKRADAAVRAARPVIATPRRSR